MSTEQRIAFRFLRITVLMVIALMSAALAAEAKGERPDQARSELIPDHYIVVLRGDVADPGAVARRMARAHGLGVSHVYDVAIKGYAAFVPPAALAAVRGHPDVLYVEADRMMHALVQTTPTGLQRMFADVNSSLSIADADDLRVDVDVAVIDTGIDYDHPDLDVVARTDCTGGSPFKASCADDQGDDGNGHGTHVAGSIGAIDNDIGVVGVAPGARLWAVKVLSDNGSGWTSKIIAGIDWVTARADQIEVANMSLGGGNSQALCDAIETSTAVGIVHVVAAGNSDADAAGSSPANCLDALTVSALADFDGRAGGSGEPSCRTDQDDTLADFSNWGQTVDIAAPGVCILSTWKDGGYNTISGTSMASPHVAGAAALLASGNNDPTSKADVDAIVDTLLWTGNFDWLDDSGDGSQEPLLDVSDSEIYAPATVAVSSGPSDSVPPVISAVEASNIGATSADITWTTDEASDSRVNYGLTTSLGSSAGGSQMVTSHSVSLSALTPETTYYFEVQSTDGSGNTATDDNGGSYYTFTTAAASGPAAIALSATGYKVKGVQHADLQWSGATSTNVDVYRDGAWIATTANDGAYTDNIDRKGGGTVGYQVCEAGTSTCSNQATVSF